MTKYNGKITLLGPQRLRTTLRSVLEERGLTGRVATITAGWQGRKLAIDELKAQIPGEMVSLDMYARTESLFERDTALLATIRQWHDQLREAQRWYRLRLDHALDAARKLVAREGDSDLLVRARNEAIEAVQTLDAQHLATKSGIVEQRHDVYRRHPSIAEEREAIRELVEGTEAVVITGGHVAVLINRLRLFEAPALFGNRPLVAWSAGAMALADRIVLFHDSPPQGAGNAEILEAGLGLFPYVVPLPHAHRRLRLNDRTRVSLFARRFAPAMCVAMDDGSRLDWSAASGWTTHRGTMRLTESGTVDRLVRERRSPSTPAPETKA